MMGYIAVGVTCLFVGGFVGVCTLSLCIAAKERMKSTITTVMMYAVVVLGAANNDCRNCTRKGDEQGEDA